MILEHDPLLDPEIKKYIDSLFPKISWDQLMQIKYNEFDSAWRNWLQTDSYNQISGLDLFTHSNFIPGTTDAFGEFIARNSKRRLRVSRSDFVITKILARTYNRDLKFLEEGILEKNDCVLLSVPYSGNGSHYPDQDKLLDLASELSVPVLIDAAYYGISDWVNYPLDKTCITDFVVSLSKNMVGDPLRLGIRFNKSLIDDCASASMIGADIFDRIGAYISIQLLGKFPQKYIIDKYRPLSDQICKNYGIYPTKTITLALGNSNMTKFRRGDYERICITDEFSRLVIK